MKYVPDLIPEHSRVQLDNDYETLDESEQQDTSLQILSYSGAALFIIGALATIFTRFWEGVPLLVIGLTLLPQGHRWIEEALKFKFKWKIKTGFILILLISTISALISYDQRDREIAAKEQAETERKAEEERLAKLEAEKQEKARRDSLNAYISIAEKRFNAKRNSEAILLLNSALAYAKAERGRIIQRRALYYFKTGKYKEALNDYSTLIQLNYDSKNVYYERALSYQKLNKKQEAVNDLRSATNLGHPEAEKLHNKINPIKRRVRYYTTLCCDGTTTSAKGRGACSHHGGVCDWNHPVYEEYREY